MKTVSTEIIEIETGRLTYIRAGQGQDLVFFIHGLGCSKESFSYAWQEWEIPERYSICVVDLPGHGESVFPVDYPYTMQAYAETCGRLLNIIAANSIHIVGHSMGGAVGLLLIRKLQEKVQSFISLEGNLCFEDCTVSRRIIGFEEQVFIKNVLPLSAGVFNCSPETKSPDPLPKALYRSAVSLVESSKSGDLLDIFLNSPPHKLYVHGERSAKPAVLQKLSNIGAISITGAGHFMMQDNRSDTYDAILSGIGAD